MARLAQRIGDTFHCSPLRRRAKSLGLDDNGKLLAVAVARGCRHYANLVPDCRATDPGQQQLSHEELAVLLLLGEHVFEPFLVRCAAALLRVAPMNAIRLARLARRERCACVLAYIAQAGAAHDPAGTQFWRQLLAELGPQRPVEPGVLPHWTRFVALQGVARTGRAHESHWIGVPA